MNDYLLSQPEGDPDLGLRGLLAMAKGFAPAQLVLTAVELGVFTVLGPKPLGIDELRERLDLHPRGCRPFLDALVDHGLLERDGVRYANAPVAAQHLDENSADYVGGWLRLTGGLYWLWPSLAASLRTGLPLSGPGDGSGSHPREWDATYVDAMAVGARAAAAAVATALDWSRYGSFLDLGGSNGTFARELVRRHGALRARGPRPGGRAPWLRRDLRESAFPGTPHGWAGAAPWIARRSGIDHRRPWSARPRGELDLTGPRRLEAASVAPRALFASLCSSSGNES